MDLQRSDRSSAAGSDSPPGLSLSGIVKTYGRAEVLHGVSIDVHAGEVHCLVGENGAGKSTLLGVLSGAVRPDRGEINVFGTTYARLHPRQAIALGISSIYQDADLVGSLSVADNVFLGMEITRAGRLDRTEQHRRTREVVESLNLDLDPSAIVSELAPADRQLVQIVKALHHHPRVMVMDEPTASLGRAQKDRLLDLVRQLAAGGLAVLYVSHHLEEVLTVADRVTVLKDGSWVATHARAECSTDLLVREMVGRSSEAFFSRHTSVRPEVLLRVVDYSGPRVPGPISFEVHRGEVLGFGGIVGSGRTDLAMLLFGAVPRTSGRLYLDGVEVTPRSPAQAIERGICLITEDRQGQGLFGHRPVRENIAIVRGELAGPLIRHEAPLVRQMVDKLRIVAASLDSEAGSLSGGNQQKTVIARWLAVDADVFILDEPTKGVDVGARQEIYGLITELANRGKAVVMISSDLPELISLSDRIAVMRQGRLVTVIGSAEATEQSLMKEFLGVAAA